MKKIEVAKKQIKADKPAGSPETPKKDTRDAGDKVAADDAAAVKDTEDKKAKALAAAPKAELGDGVATKLVPALAVTGTINGSSKFYNSEAELWTENMPKHVQTYNAGLGSTTFSNTKFSKPWGADIE